MYDPWSVINFLYDLCANADGFPHPYWVNTSSNDIIKALIARADRETKGHMMPFPTGNGSLYMAAFRVLPETFQRMCLVSGVLPLGLHCLQSFWNFAPHH